MRFPLTLKFKSIAIARQVTVEDANGQLVWYAKAATFALKESVTIYRDLDEQRPMYRIASNSMIDVGARYDIEDAATRTQVGAVRHVGEKSLLHTHYEILRDGNAVFVVKEENPLAKFLDHTIGVIPLLGYFFNPRYVITRAGRGAIARLRKEPALFSERYSILRSGTLQPDEEQLLLQGLVMVAILEKERV